MSKTDDSICDRIELFSTSGFLKVNMCVQATFGLLSIVSMVLTIPKLLSTVIIDRTFKEYILLGYFIQAIQAASLAALQITLLATHLFNKPCEAYISWTLCLDLRIVSTVGMSGLSYLTVALTIYRFLVLRLGLHNASEALKTARCFLSVAFLLNALHVYFKYNGVHFVGYTAYCTGNLSSLHVQMTAEAVIISLCEAFSVIGGSLLFRTYKKTTRSFEVNSSLTRKQAIQTFHLFVPYSIVHAACFCVTVVSTSLYREFLWERLPDPYYSAGTGFLFFPMYFSTFAPWLIYYIIRREEKKRVRGTRDLLSKEGAGSHDTYFRIMKHQWNGPAIQTTKDSKPKSMLQTRIKPVIAFR